MASARCNRVHAVARVCKVISLSVNPVFATSIWCVLVRSSKATQNTAKTLEDTSKTLENTSKTLENTSETLENTSETPVVFMPSGVTVRPKYRPSTAFIQL